jgi:hypothetical protein
VREEERPFYTRPLTVLQLILLLWTVTNQSESACGFLLSFRERYMANVFAAKSTREDHFWVLSRGLTFTSKAPAVCRAQPLSKTIFVSCSGEGSAPLLETCNNNKSHQTLDNQP